MLEEYGIGYGDDVEVTISCRGRIVYGYVLKLCRNFTEVEKGEALVYVNSLLNVGIAVNQGSFAQEYGIGTGEGWLIRLGRG